MTEWTGGVTHRPTVVLGVVGADVHIVGAKILDFALTEAGFRHSPKGLRLRA